VFSTLLFYYLAFEGEAIVVKMEIVWTMHNDNFSAGSEFCQFSQFLITLVGLVLLIMLCKMKVVNELRIQAS
jgi:hypothetical protein